MVKVVSWYDNEMSYTAQLIRTLRYFVKLVQNINYLDESRNSHVKGYGIGLSMAQVIAEKHKEVIKAYAPKDGIFSIETRFTLDEKKQLAKGQYEIN